MILLWKNYIWLNYNTESILKPYVYNIFTYFTFQEITVTLDSHVSVNGRFERSIHWYSYLKHNHGVRKTITVLL